MVLEKWRRGKWELADDGPYRLLVRSFIPANPVSWPDEDMLSSL